MRYSMKLVSALYVLGASAIALAQELDKPALTSNLDYLLEGNEAALPETAFKFLSWEEETSSHKGSIPLHCKAIAGWEGLSPSDFEIFDVTYEDCGDPWTFCRHKDAPSSFEAVAATFGKLPVKMRDWVRHVAILPGDNSSYNWGGTMAFFGTAGENINVNIHAAAHNLMGFMAFGEIIDLSDGWLEAYNADSHVPSEYARSSQEENVAQNTVVAVYDVNVKGPSLSFPGSGMFGGIINVAGGFPAVQPEYEAIQSQYEYIKQLAGDTLIPGGTCNRHVEPSVDAPMEEEENTVVPSSTLVARAAATEPATAFKGKYTNIVKESTPFLFGKH